MVGRRDAPYDEPFGWWGPAWKVQVPRSVPDLLLDRVLTPPAAGLLWALLARRASVLVAAGPSGAGKTTLLTALLDLLPAGTRRIYLRGCYEPFHFLSDPAVDPQRTALLVNEISPHLPSYLWGPGVRRFLTAKRDGFLLAATAHATRVEDLVGSLAGYPLRIPPEEIAAVDLVILLDAWEEHGVIRREITEIAALAAVPGRNGVRVDRLLRRDVQVEVPADVPLLERVGLSGGALVREAAERGALLAELGASGIAPGEMAATLSEVGERWLPVKSNG